MAQKPATRPRVQGTIVRPAARGRLRSSASILPAGRQGRLLRPPRGTPRPPLRSFQLVDSRLDNFDGLPSLQLFDSGFHDYSRMGSSCPTWQKESWSLDENLSDALVLRACAEEL